MNDPTRCQVTRRSGMRRPLDLGGTGRWMLLVIAAAAVLLSAAQRASAAALKVCQSGCPYTQLAPAVAAAQSGDEIKLGPGTYAGGVTIDRERQARRRQRRQDHHSRRRAGADDRRGRRAERADHEVVGTSQGFRVARAMSWSTSLLAIVVGVLGVMNTMLMTVFERTHEIGILLAVGWKRLRIVYMVLCESALLGFFGGVAGVAIGAIGLKIMEQTPTVRGMLEPDTSPRLLLTSVAIAVVVGVISGLYPAWRSSRLSPAVALHAD